MIRVVVVFVPILAVVFAGLVWSITGLIGELRKPPAGQHWSQP